MRIEGKGRFLLYVKIACLAALCFVGIFAHAQAPAVANNLQGSTLTLNPVYVPPATGVMFTLSQTGTQTYYYWIITHQGGHPSAMSGPWAITQARAIASAVPITVQWQAPQGTGFTYDLLRTTTSGPPSGTGNFAVVAGTPVARKVDNVTSLASYAVAPAVPCVMTQSTIANCPASGGGTIDGTVSSPNVPFASGPDALSDSLFQYQTSGCPDGASIACFEIVNAMTSGVTDIGSDGFFTFVNPTGSAASGVVTAIVEGGSTATAPMSPFAAYVGSLEITPTAPDAVDYFGAAFQSDAEGTVEITGDVVGVLGKGDSGSDSDTGTANIIIGVEGNINTGPTGSSNEADALRAESPLIEGVAPTITNGLDVQDQGAMGRAANGIHIEAQTNAVPIQVDGAALAQLGAASDHPGGWATVSDSTTVAVEGQTCVGSSTSKALAFSDGTVWKCF